MDGYQDIRKIAVAVSGGADSMALLLLTHTWALKKKMPVTALTVDHGLRVAAAKEAKMVASWCAKRKIPHHTLVWRANKPKANIQAKAREARYNLLHDWCKKNKYTHLRNLFLVHLP